MAAASTQVCTFHRHHDPAPTYTELHHVIPQAWQVFWQPPAPWPNGGPSPDRKAPGSNAPFLLFDARTVALCRTGHGNVHHWLVQIMQAFARLGSVGEAMHEVKAAARARGQVVGTADFGFAAEAIDRWHGAGGDLRALTDHGLWGEI